MIVEVFKRTDDNWYGSYKIDEDSRVNMLVEVIFTQTGPDPKNGNGEWRVCVWGNDDYGMEIDFTDETTAWNIYLQVIGWEVVNIDSLKSIGFINA